MGGGKMTIYLNFWEIGKTIGEILVIGGIGLFIGMWLMNPFR